MTWKLLTSLLWNLKAAGVSAEDAVRFIYLTIIKKD